MISGSKRRVPIEAEESLLARFSLTAEKTRPEDLKLRITSIRGYLLVCRKTKMNPGPYSSKISMGKSKQHDTIQNSS